MQGGQAAEAVVGPSNRETVIRLVGMIPAAQDKAQDAGGDGRERRRRSCGVLRPRSAKLPDLG